MTLTSLSIPRFLRPSISRPMFESTRSTAFLVKSLSGEKPAEMAILLLDTDATTLDAGDFLF